MFDTCDYCSKETEEPSYESSGLVSCPDCSHARRYTEAEKALIAAREEAETALIEDIVTWDNEGLDLLTP